FLFFSDKKRRLLYISVAALCAALLVVAIPKLFAFFWPTIQRLLETLFKQEARILLYRRAVEDFLAHPFFGTGIGYMGNRDVHPSREFALCWYHCAPLQIIGSLGCVGVAAYLYQYVTRVRVFLRSRTNFHWTLLLSWLALEMMSLVNPGVFVPLPYLLLVTMFTVFAEKTPAPAADAVASP
ncbi:MAG: O-antigen ligase family protein, partial [Oscillospiraceae bacterium]|nr:O-antigen ligase family protein [Oscillospiraceae bacterium]